MNFINKDNKWPDRVMCQSVWAHLWICYNIKSHNCREDITFWWCFGNKTTNTKKCMRRRTKLRSCGVDESFAEMLFSVVLNPWFISQQIKRDDRKKTLLYYYYYSWGEKTRHHACRAFLYYIHHCPLIVHIRRNMVLYTGEQVSRK